MILFSGSDDGTLLRESWQYYFEKGKLQYRAEMYDYCLENMDNALRKNPRLYEAANIIAEIQDSREKKYIALDYYTRSLEIRSDQPEIHYRAALIYEYLARFDQAFSHLREAVNLDPGHVRAHAALVRFYLKDNQAGKAEEHFRISKEKSGPAARELLLQADRARREKNYEGAEELYRRAMDLYPALEQAYLELYEMYRVLDRYDRAAKTLEDLVFIKPDHGRAHLFLANLYFTSRLPGASRKFYLDKSLAHIKKALEQDPRNAESWHLLAEIHTYMGDDIEAEKSRKKAHELEMEK